MNRWLIMLAVLALMLLPAAPVAAAHKADGMAVTASPSGANQFVFQVQNTGDSVVKSFVLVLGSGFTATGLVSASAGTCQLTGASVACSGLALAPGCPCNPGESVYVTLSGSGDTAGTGVVQIVGASAPAAATPVATAASVPVNTPSTTAPATTSATKASIASIRPSKARAGGKITVTGANLTGTTAVRIGRLAARFTITPNGRLLVTVPTKAVSGKLSVKTGGAWTTSTTALRIA